MGLVVKNDAPLMVANSATESLLVFAYAAPDTVVNREVAILEVMTYPLPAVVLNTLLELPEVAKTICCGCGEGISFLFKQSYILPYSRLSG